MLALYMSFIDDESHRRLFEKIYIEYRDPMFFMARSVLGNDSDAEDIVHDVFLKIAKKHMARTVSYTHLDVYKRQDESCVVEFFRLDPEIFAGLIAVSLRVDDDRIDQLEDVLLAARCV